MKTILLAALLVSAAGPAFAFLDNTGGSAAQFLQIGAGARPYGMGDAFCAVAEGPDAMHWNVAGLAGMKAPSFSYTHAEPAASVRHEYAAYGHPVPFLKGTLGVSLTYMAADSLPVVTNANLESGRFTPNSESFSLAYATKFGIGEHRSSRDYYGEYWNVPGVHRPLSQGVEPWTGTLQAGIGFKYARENIHKRSGSAFLFDGGVLFRPVWLKGLALGFAFRNLGEQLRFIDSGRAAPAEFDFGAAYLVPVKRSRFLAAAGVTVPYYGSPEGRLGLEYGFRLNKSLEAALRLGMKSRTFDDLDPVTALTAGVGLGMGRTTVDIGIQPMAELGVGYKVSLGYRF
ncbi:MAG: hypothetical protein WC943_10545 [Elusimicrobiota bacterium]|jgi:hypothetical protein